MPPTQTIKVSDIKEVTPDPVTGAIVLKVDAVQDVSVTELEIAITTDLAPGVAIALLATTAKARAQRDGLTPALEVLAAAVVATGNAEKVRLHLLFEQGAVLPIEMNTSSSNALGKELAEVAKAAG